MNREEVKNLIYQRFIEPTKEKRDVYVGVEIELPIINLEKKEVNFELVHEVTELFKDKFNFDVSKLDDNLKICALKDPVTNDIYTFDCSYNNIEFSFGREKNIYDVKGRFEEYYAFIQEFLKAHNYTLSGFGVNPYRHYNKLVPVPNGRYRMLYHHLCSYPNFSHEKKFHDMPEFGMFSSASQVQIDIEYDKLISTINAFTKLEPINAILFSNSVLIDENGKVDGEYSDLICSRDMLWEDSMQGYNKKNFGMYDPIPQSIDELLDYMLNTSLYCTEQDRKYINFPPELISDYFTKKEISGEYFEDGKYHKINFKPEINDFNYFRTFKFEDMTFRGTIESRSVCTQPVKDSMAFVAFHLGLINQTEKVNEILDRDTVIFNNGYSASELRELFVKKDLPKFVDEEKLKRLLREILDLSKEGLKLRGNNEEQLLNPLYERVKVLENPGQKLIKHINSGKNLEDLIYEYSKI